MLYTSAEANKLLRSLREEKFKLEREEDASITFVAATVENPEDARPEYDFAAMQRRLEEIDKLVRKIKHAISVFNTTHVVPGTNMTVDEVLVYMPQLEQAKNKYLRMSQKLQKERVGRKYGDKPSANFIEYEYANYDVEEAKKKHRDVSDELASIQIALDKLNTTSTFEIEY